MTHQQKLEAALTYLGPNWVLSLNSTYDAKKRLDRYSTVLTEWKMRK